MVSLSIEHAKSGRSSCKTCRVKIEKGDIRWIKTSESEKFGEIKAYSHLDCLKLAKKSVDDHDFGDIEFLGDFSKKEKKLVEKAWEKIKSPPEKEKTTSKHFKNENDKEKDKTPKAKKGKKKRERERSNSDSDDDYVGSSAKKKKKKKRKAMKKKSGVEVEYHEKPELSKEESLRAKYGAMSISQLKDYLRLNKQLLAGKKNELVEKCVDGERFGALPKCGVCTEGRLKKLENGSIACSGYYDEDCGMRIACDFSAAADKVKRCPWKDVNDETLDEDGDTGDQSNKEEIKNGISEDLKNVLLKLFSDEKLKPKEIASKMVDFARTNKLALPEDDSLARQKVGSLLMQNRNENNKFDVVEVYKGLLQQFGKKKVSDGKDIVNVDGSDNSQPQAKNPENTAIANLLQKVATLTAKTGGNPFKIRALKKSVIAIRGLDFKIESGKQVSTGKQKVAGVGKGTAKMIDEFLETGEVVAVQELEELAASQDMAL